MRTEHQEQVALCNWLDWNKIAYVAIPNAGKRSYRTASRLKAEGMQRGFPDLLVLNAPPNALSLRGCAIEMKRIGGRVTIEQSAWLDKLIELGWAAFFAHGAADAIRLLTNLGYGRP